MHTALIDHQRSIRRRRHFLGHTAQAVDFLVQFCLIPFTGGFHRILGAGEKFHRPCPSHLFLFYLVNFIKIIMKTNAFSGKDDRFSVNRHHLQRIVFHRIQQSFLHRLRRRIGNISAINIRVRVKYLIKINRDTDITHCQKPQNTCCHNHCYLLLTHFLFSPLNPEPTKFNLPFPV